MLYNVVRFVRSVREVRLRIIRILRTLRIKGFLRSTGVYLKDHSPYLDSSLYSNNNNSLINI